MRLYGERRAVEGEVEGRTGGRRDKVGIERRPNRREAELEDRREMKKKKVKRKEKENWEQLVSCVRGQWDPQAVNLTPVILTQPY